MIVGIVIFTVDVNSADCTKGHGIILGNCFVLAGVCGICAYSPKRVRSYTKPTTGISKLSRPERFPAMVFVISCLIAASLMYADIDALDCAIKVETLHDGEEKPFPFFGVAHVVCLHVGHILAAIGVGLASPDFWALRGNSQSGSSLRSSPLKDVKCKSSKQALHLPEAKTHVQEAVGSGDKITVVSLPQTDGIVYAVPEEQYVVRKDEATYLAPTGNTKLTAFFPTYNRVPAD